MVVIKPNKLGFVIGGLIACSHVLWILLVLFGVAQPLMNFIFWAHMIQPVYTVKAFDPKAALTLIGITFVVGYALGLIGAFFWNKLHRG